MKPILSRILPGCLAAALLCAGLTGVAQAQQTAQPQAASGQTPPTEAEMAQMRRDVATAAAYPLPRDFLPRMTAALGELRQAGLQPPTGRNLSLEQTIQAVSSVPGVEPVLRKHGFTPRDFVIGLTGFGITHAVLSDPQAQASGQAPRLNQENVALLQNNQQQVTELLAEMGATPPQKMQQIQP
ncbi:hypothetical protein LOC54_11340 [Acetobacter sp. AN02]|uniref:hypothetical protein n=1 Tax=Acetobacter sp. AN02 TaxID=2894186 RepID=UPI0024342B1A|nr:hypothetical protein [Acetobacter sp. AN02]MDG6095669.1 hypothetical protein [Acetobacter sp. AN02]